jgi:hypothetical protein
MPPPLPTVSVVIASGAGGEFLFRLLDALEPQAKAEAVEVIVADRTGGATAQRLAARYGWATVVPVGRGPDGRKPSVPQLRAAAAARARGDVVAVIEEHCRPPPGWLRAIRESFSLGEHGGSRASGETGAGGAGAGAGESAAREPGGGGNGPVDAAIGGPILDDGWKRRRDWVVLFSEYHNYLPPWGDGERRLLNGANIAYRRSLLEKHRDVLATGYWEVVLHPRLEKEGRMRGLDRLAVHHTGPFDYRYYLRQRFLLSRVWGAMQRERTPGGRRLLYLVAAPLFPFLLLLRVAARACRSPYLGQYLLTLPLLVPVAFAYVLGEWTGYAFGFGNALEEVE